MKSLRTASLIIFMGVFVFCSENILAQHDHGSHGGSHTSHEQIPPNGGIIKEAGKYKIEMVADIFLKTDQLRFYIFKGNYKTILNKGITGTIIIKYNDGNEVKAPLQAKGDDFFVAQLKDSESFQATVKFTIKGKTVTAIFSHNGIGQQVTTTYVCPMHPEIKSDTSGTCPKCGMNLEKQ